MSTYPPPPRPPPNNYLYTRTPNHEPSFSVTTVHGDFEDIHRISRTPSPTLSEYNALNDIKEEKSLKQKILLYGVGALVIGAVVTFSYFHEKIINALSPATDWLRDHNEGPVIVIGILVVMSFPPLFGHELVEMLAGVTWDLAPAFAIVSAGVLLGEIANYFTFKYCCAARSKKEEKSKLSYALLAHVVRTGGFVVVLMIRYSAMPPHSACVLSLPKAWAPVYIGWAMRPSNDDNATSSKVEKIIMIVSIGITILALGWIRRQMNAAKPEVIHARRKARQGK
ncbi:hypothetical protein MVEN_02522300 [Mycena venus]|uniref:Golgi apparatus membrane protein TVP38 n=1 Tax=Mycena venus TaxID=2733690 RepID=A0A8H6WUM9_9AGAR|nr:hypothetical protein MVEN_02522300 [Mycena venus]